MCFVYARDKHCYDQRLNYSCLSSKMTLQQCPSSLYLHASSNKKYSQFLNESGWPFDLLWSTEYYGNAAEHLITWALRGLAASVFVFWCTLTAIREIVAWCTEWWETAWKQRHSHPSILTEPIPRIKSAEFSYMRKFRKTSNRTTQPELWKAKHCSCFRSLNFGVVGYTAMSNWNTKCSQPDFRQFLSSLRNWWNTANMMPFKNTFWLKENETRDLQFRKKAKEEAEKIRKKKNKEHSLPQTLGYKLGLLMVLWSERVTEGERGHLEI